MVILRFRMLPGSKTMDTLVKLMYNNKTVSQVQDFKIMGIIIRRSRCNDAISHCSYCKHHKTLTPLHLAIAITLDEMSISKDYRSIFWTLVNGFLKYFILQKEFFIVPYKICYFYFPLNDYLCCFPLPWYASFVHEKMLEFFPNVLSLSWRISTCRWFQIEPCATGCILSPIIRNNSTTPIVKIN